MRNKKTTPNRKMQVLAKKAETKTFNYSKGGVSLSFSLRTDVKNELQDFESCLEKALDDVRDEINK